MAHFTAIVSFRSYRSQEVRAVTNIIRILRTGTDRI